MTDRGVLRIYLGAAPGVGKTFAMLDEGRRRAGRGTDVVIGFVATHGRPHTAEQIGELEIIPPTRVGYRGSDFAEMDLEAIVRRRPQVALVDELAHTNVPGSGHNTKRWQDVQALLDAGIEVITTLNVQHLESLNDVVEEITGVPQRETVPDSVVRAAEQIELVDMTPEALRRRMAHGNIYPPEKIDAALGNYFRSGNLTALRELALLWVADQVEAGLQKYREQHGITKTWETKERIVVALTGGPEGEALIRRAARIAARSSGADLVAVHVSRGDGLRDTGVAELETQRVLIESLGGTFHSVSGTDVPKAILDFARSVDATQVVLGASRRRPWLGLLAGPGTGQTVTRLSGPVDVHIVGHDYAGRGLSLPALRMGLSRRRQLLGAALAVILLAAITRILVSVRPAVEFPATISIYLLVVVVTSLVGGFWPALAAAIAGSLLLNYYFVEPTHTFTIAQGNNVVALIIFTLVAILVSQVVDRSARRSVLAARRGAEAEALAALAGSLLRGEQAIPALLARVQETFGMRGAALLAREPGAHWNVVDSVGDDAPPEPASADASVDIGEDRLLALRGKPLHADDRRLLTAFAAEVAVAYQQRDLAEAKASVQSLRAAERARTALLNAVSHDLRTPIAEAKASVSSLLAADISWPEAARHELLVSADDALDRLTDLVTNLLDLSRLQADVLPVLARPMAVADVIARALDQLAVPPGRVRVQIPDDLPDVSADAGLLERALANLIQNAVRFSPAGTPVDVTASTAAGKVEIHVIDRGPGIKPEDEQSIFVAFQRRDDHPVPGAGVGLGLAIARGFTEAMGGTVTTEQTPGGGATFVVQLTTGNAVTEACARNEP